MTRVEGEIIVGRPMQEVCDFVADERNEPRYNPRMVCPERISEGQVGLVTRFRAQFRTMERTMRMVIEFGV